jgi:hypothetical protein
MNIFKEAKKYQRQHPKTDWQTCIQKVKGVKRVGTAKKKSTRKKVGAYKVIEKGEKKSTPTKKVYRAVRSKAGTFKGMQKITGADIKEHAKQGLAKALFDYEMAKTVKATKEAAARKTKYRKLLKSI